MYIYVSLYMISEQGRREDLVRLADINKLDSFLQLIFIGAWGFVICQRAEIKQIFFFF